MNQAHVEDIVIKRMKTIQVLLLYHERRQAAKCMVHVPVSLHSSAATDTVEREPAGISSGGAWLLAIDCSGNAAPFWGEYEAVGRSIFVSGRADGAPKPFRSAACVSAPRQ